MESCCLLKAESSKRAHYSQTPCLVLSSLPQAGIVLLYIQRWVAGRLGRILGTELSGNRLWCCEREDGFPNTG